MKAIALLLLALVATSCNCNNDDRDQFKPYPDHQEKNGKRYNN